jgi:glycosyltransferase involved in cell wall biosynthesis
MRIAVAGEQLAGFSGIPPHLIAALREHAEVARWDLPPYRPTVASRIRARISRGTYLWEKDPRRCAWHSRALDELAARGGADAVLLIGSESCAFSRTATPIFGFGDSIFGSRVDLYPDQLLDRVNPRSVRDGIDVQQRALDKCRRFFSTSQWAWVRAVNRFGYRVAPEQLQVTLIGANLPAAAPAPPVPATPLRLLWVGGDWKRKCGDLAISVVGELRVRGIDAELDVVGAVQPPPSPEWVRIHGRRTPETGLGDLYAHASALILPTLADLTPVAIAEAAMYGRPAIASPTGAIPEMIRDGESGLLIEGYDPRQWADAIAARAASFPRYGLAARRRYDEQLNWAGISRRIVQCITETR